MLRTGPQASRQILVDDDTLAWLRPNVKSNETLASTSKVGHLININGPKIASYMGPLDSQAYLSNLLRIGHTDLLQTYMYIKAAAGNTNGAPRS